MTQPGVFTPYSTIAPLLGQLPGWVPALDKERVASYGKYEEMYWSSESGFDRIMRGDNDTPITLPTARTLVNAVDRYTAPDFGWHVQDAAPAEQAVDNAARADTGPSQAVRVAEMAFTKLFRRERFLSAFNANKLEGGFRGDWLWHVVADPAKPLGRRLTIRALDPGSYFPVYSDDDPDRIVKVHIAEQITVDGTPLVSRLTYTKLMDEETGVVLGITRSHGLFKTDKWWELTTPEQTILAEETLPPEITSIPVYHVKMLTVNAPFGSSYLRGLESALGAVNQAISDEDLTLAMEGLGVYATDGGPPLDEDNNETDVVMGPARIIANANGLRRINGVGSVSPYTEHLHTLKTSLQEALGASDVTIGAVQSGEAESGIALLLRLGPMLAQTGMQDQHIVDVHTQMFYDLCFWLAVYEELPLLTGSGAEAVPLVEVLPTIGSKVPVNQVEVIDNVVKLRNCVPPVVSLETSHAWLRAAGLDVPDNELELLAAEAQQALDVLGEPALGDELADDARVAEELEVLA